MKKIIIALTIVSILLGVFLITSSLWKKNDFKREDENFYNAISSLKEEDYRKAFEYANSIENVEKQKCIKNIIAHKYIIEINDSVKQMTAIEDKLNSIINTVSITSIYGNIKVDEDKQLEIDKMGEQLYLNYDNNISNKFSKDILYDDLSNLYTSFNKTMESYRGVYNNLEYKFVNEKDNFVDNLNTIVANIKELSNYINDVSNLHPISEVDEKYQIMFFEKN